MRHAAYHDNLTNLANRAQFALAMFVAEENEDGYALFLIDLDRFKPVNDTHGHAAGDAVLKSTAERLLTVSPPTSTVARLGGDEFAVLIHGAWTAVEADTLADSIVAVLRRPILYECTSLDIGASVGHVRVERGTSGQIAMRRADVAMYHAKKSGRGMAWAAERSRDQ